MVYGSNANSKRFSLTVSLYGGVLVSALVDRSGDRIWRGDAAAAKIGVRRGVVYHW